jgi:small subunit ribosomal protein S6
MKLYELSLIINPELKEEEANRISQEIISLIQEKGGILDNLREIKLINLAYPIQKKERGFFSSFSFYFKPEETNLLDKELKNNKNILRYLLVKKEPSRLKKTARVEKKESKKKVDFKKIEEKLDEIIEKEIDTKN